MAKKTTTTENSLVKKNSLSRPRVKKPAYNSGAEAVLKKAASLFSRPVSAHGYKGKLRVGVDLGTAYTVLAVLDENDQPIAGRYKFAQVVRDGVVVDFFGAINLVKELKELVEKDIGRQLTQAAACYPPGVSPAEVKATRNVLIGAGMECETFVDEPTAANSLLQVQNGAIVDVGGGTTGIAIIEKGKVIYTADEPTGGTQFSLVIAGAKDISFEEAEKFKTSPKHRATVQSMVIPVMQKVGSIIARHIAPYDVETIYLVGGTSSMPGMADIIKDMTDTKTIIPSYPMLVTPIGLAMNDK